MAERLTPYEKLTFRWEMERQEVQRAADHAIAVGDSERLWRHLGRAYRALHELNDKIEVMDAAYWKRRRAKEQAA